MSFTPEQQKAIDAPGNTLVVAGAGAGKTGTLAERCTRLLLRTENPVPVSKVLVVTFTDAAAAEIRARIRQRLDSAWELDPENLWIQEQIAGLDAAHISTLHSFCLALIRENFYALDFDPGVSVLPAEQAEMLFATTFEELLSEHLAGAHGFSGELKEIVRAHFRGWDKPVCDLIRHLHHFTQTRPDPEGWFQTQLAMLNQADPAQWRQWHQETIGRWCEEWVPYLASLPASNENAHACAALLKQACRGGDIEVIQAVLNRKDCWTKGKKGEQSKAIGSLFEEAAFLESLSAPEALEQDWNWSRAPLRILLQFAQQFTTRFTEAKRSRGMVDFHDLEQCALRLLWNPRAQKPTPLADRWRKRFEAVFVDEYQDINAAQDLIITTVSRPAPPGNRFLVGDIKQSIYAFRQASPSIFRGYLSRKESWEIAILADNFRSHEGILDFINPLFSWLMHEPVGGVRYDQDALLRFGSRAQRADMTATAAQPWPVELHLLVSERTRSEPEEDSESSDTLSAELENAEKEARLVAQRLRELHDRDFLIYDQKEKRTRPVEWRDMVVLVRSATGKLEIYAKAFEAVGVPLLTKRDGFFTAIEVLDFLNILTILDNPLQDIPLVAVLRSPIFGFSSTDLALIRAHTKQGRFWESLKAFLEHKVDSSTRRKVERFMTSYHRWRNPRECSSIADRLEAMLVDTGYAEWLLGQERGRQRHANIQQLLRVARQFDHSRGESLYLFLRHIQELQDAAGDIEPAALAETEAVRLMTVHQSKGLEFPVVAVADLGKTFNTSSQSATVLLHEKFGISSMIKPPHAGQRYPSLPHWLAAREERCAALGEEMRIFYVALTRAENRLLLFGSATEKQIATHWPERATASPFPQQLLRTRSWLDWLGCYGAWHWPDWTNTAKEKTLPFTLRIHREFQAAIAPPSVTELPWTLAELESAKARLPFAYAHQLAACEPAKGSVSLLRKRAAGNADEAADLSSRFFSSASKAEARSRGVATHNFLQNLDLAGNFDRQSLESEAHQLADEGFLELADHDRIDFAGIAAFWNSEFGHEIRTRISGVRREFPFTFKAAGHELAALGLPHLHSLPGDEFILIQGVADLVVLHEAEIWLVDFKTDQVTTEDISARAADYKPQLALYALALQGIYRKPVTRRALFFLAPQRFAWC